MSTFLTEITAIWGCRGSGKSTLAKKLAGDHKPKQLVFIDPLAKEGVGAIEMIKKLQAKSKYVVVNAQSKPEQQAAIVGAYLCSTPDTPVYIICDEAPSYLDQLSDALNKIMFQGRHASCGMTLIGQRAAAVSAQMRSQAASTYWMKLTDHVDLQTASKVLGPRAQGLDQLPAGGFIKHPE